MLWSTVFSRRIRSSSTGYRMKHASRSTVVFLFLTHEQLLEFHTQTFAKMCRLCLFFFFFSLPVSITVHSDLYNRFIFTNALYYCNECLLSLSQLQLKFLRNNIKVNVNEDGMNWVVLLKTDSSTFIAFYNCDVKKGL